MPSVKMSFEVYEFESEDKKNLWNLTNSKADAMAFYLFSDYQSALEFAAMMKHVVVLQHYTVSDLVPESLYRRKINAD